VKHNVHQVQRKQIDSYKVCSNVHHWHEHKDASLLAKGQLRRQSATAPSIATHADAVATDQCHDSDVIFSSRVK